MSTGQGYKVWQLGGFLFLSLALHLVLLTQWKENTELKLFDQSQGTISINIVKQAITSAPKAAIKQSTVKHSSKVQPDQAIQEKTASSYNAQKMQAQLLERLRTRLSEHFHYPALALRKGWEGTVILQVHIRHDGQLSDIRLHNSSGYAVLDQSALTALGQVKQLDNTSQWLQGRDVVLNIPVRYQIKRG